MLKKKLTPEELQKQREEAERKARRGEIEPTHDFTFCLIGQFTGQSIWRERMQCFYRFYPGLIKHQILEFVFEDPTILDELDHLYKTLDLGKKLLFYFQPEDPSSDGGERQSVALGAEETGERTLVLYKDKLRNIQDIKKERRNIKMTLFSHQKAHHH